MGVRLVTGVPAVNAVKWLLKQNRGPCFCRLRPCSLFSWKFAVCCLQRALLLVPPKLFFRICEGGTLRLRGCPFALLPPLPKRFAKRKAGHQVNASLLMTPHHSCCCCEPNAILLPRRVGFSSQAISVAPSPCLPSPPVSPVPSMALDTVRSKRPMHTAER